MTTDEYCGCETSWLDNGRCLDCGMLIDPERLTRSQKRQTLKGSGILGVTPPARSKNGQIDFGNAAANRVEKYSTLFDNLASLSMILYWIVSIFVIIGVSIFFKNVLVTVFSILLLSAAGFGVYLQVAFQRGIASYFQMKSSEFKLKNWE